MRRNPLDFVPEEPLPTDLESLNPTVPLGARGNGALGKGGHKVAGQLFSRCVRLLLSSGVNNGFGLAVEKQPGDKAQVTFTEAGYYTYRCNEHPEFPGMKGLVFVTDQ